VIRLERRLRANRVQEGSFSNEQSMLELASRGRSARKVRTHLRRMEAVVMLTPRWSRPQSFLEGIAMDLAVGHPALGCRTASFQHLKNRSTTEAWRTTLSLIAQLGGSRGDNLQITAPGSRKGFRSAVTTLLRRVTELSEAPVALLGHSAEYLPLEVLEDLALGWLDFTEMYPSPEDRRVVMMLAGCVDTPLFNLPGAPRVSLTDYGEAEAAAALVSQTGPAEPFLLEGAARFTGGVPAMVDALGRGARELGIIPRSQSGLIRALGPTADEIRGAVDIMAADNHIADRLEMLRDGYLHDEEPELDSRLFTAGLLRHVRVPGATKVALRAPAIGSLLG